MNIKLNPQDAYLLEQYNWQLNSRGSLTTSDSKHTPKTLILARIVANAKPGDVVIHKDGNKLNNTLQNLQIKNRSYVHLKRSIPSQGIKKVPSGKYQVLVGPKSYGTFKTKAEALAKRKQILGLILK